MFEIVNNGAAADPSYASAPTTLVSFNGSNGSRPYGSLIADANGDLFGTTGDGGANGDGTVLEIAKTGAGYASSPTTLVNFNYWDGWRPEGGLIADAHGDLFGTTKYGGGGSAGYAIRQGTVFEIVNDGATADPSYASTPITLVNFNGADGANPVYGSLIADANGNLFGTTGENEGYGGSGAVFEISGLGALSLTVNGDTPFAIGAAIAGVVPFAVGGLQSDYNGTVSFSDGSHAPVVVNIVNGLLSSTTANLGGLNDGAITATLHLNKRRRRQLLR